MFIELTDHLRCPEPHDEQYLVLLPGAAEQRRVRTGELGCPVCGRVWALVDGVFDAGGGSVPADDAAAVSADALIAFAGLNGPGGYLVLAGTAASRWREVQAQLPGVGLVAWNPPATILDEPGVSVLRGKVLPLKRNSMRGVLLGGEQSRDLDAVRDALRVTLPGLRVAGEGPAPAGERMELLAEGGGWWVGTKKA